MISRAGLDVFREEKNLLHLPRFETPDPPIVLHAAVIFFYKFPQIVKFIWHFLGFLDDGFEHYCFPRCKSHVVQYVSDRPTTSAKNEGSTFQLTLSAFSHTTRGHITENNNILGCDTRLFGQWITSFQRNLLFNLQDSSMDA